MGLDMYAFTADASVIGDQQVDVVFYDKEGNPLIARTELAYWRKFNNLHGWMHTLYNEKGGADPQFNCNNVRLMPEDLDRLEKLAQAKALEPVEGFLFGSQEDMTDDDREEILDFVSKAREAIEQDKAVFYSSWW